MKLKLSFSFHTVLKKANYIKKSKLILDLGR